MESGVVSRTSDDLTKNAWLCHMRTFIDNLSVAASIRCIGYIPIVYWLVFRLSFESTTSACVNSTDCDCSNLGFIATMRCSAKSVWLYSSSKLESEVTRWLWSIHWMNLESRDDWNNWECKRQTFFRRETEMSLRLRLPSANRDNEATKWLYSERNRV